MGAWQIFQAIFSHLVVGSTTPFVLVALSIAIVGVIWWRLGCRPQRIFRQAARDDRNAERLRLDLRRGMANDAAYDSLVPLYREIVEGGEPDRIPWEFFRDADGKNVLAVAVPFWSDDPNVARLTWGASRPGVWKDRTSRFAPERQLYMDRVRGQSVHANMVGDEEGYNAALSSLSLSKNLNIGVHRATYGQIVRTSDSLLHEFALFGFLSLDRSRGRHIRIPESKVLRLLPWRRQVHSWSGNKLDLLSSPEDRAAGLGVSVVAVVDCVDGVARGLVARRSSKVGTYPEVLHVVPSGMVNLHGTRQVLDQQVLDGLVETTILAEFLEECFDVMELDGTPLVDVQKVVQSHLVRLGLEGLRPTIAGIAIDLLNLRPEICAALDLRRFDGILDRIRLCWEYARHSQIERVLLSDSYANCQRSDFVQSGAAALWLVGKGIKGVGIQ